MVERIAFKGKLPDATAAMTNEEFIRLIKSRARRYIKRNSLQYRDLMERVKESKASGNKKPIRTHTRETVIFPAFVGLEFDVYDGKVFQKVHVTAPMVGHRLGEFAPTTKRVQHSSPGIKATRGSKFLSVK
jgi:small subunit ribosomal protein S19